MKVSILELSPEVLCDLLGLPPGAVVQAAEVVDQRYGVVRLRVTGMGDEVKPGHAIPVNTNGTITTTRIGERRFYAVEWGAAYKPLDN